jgi:hypothetical protein
MPQTLGHDIDRVDIGSRAYDSGDSAHKGQSNATQGHDVPLAIGQRFV